MECRKIVFHSFSHRALLRSSKLAGFGTVTHLTIPRHLIDYIDSLSPVHFSLLDQAGWKSCET